MTAQVVRIVDSSTRAEIETVLRDIVHRAKRCVPKVGCAALETEWDRCHDLIDHVLQDWQEAR